MAGDTGVDDIQQKVMKGEIILMSKILAIFQHQFDQIHEHGFDDKRVIIHSRQRIDQ